MRLSIVLAAVAFLLPVRARATSQSGSLNGAAGNVTGTMTAGYFIGNGAGLKNLPAGVEVTNGSMIGNGTSGSALAVNPASGTLQGNVFNGPGQLAQLNSAGNVVLPYGIQAATAVFSNGTFAVVVATGVNGYSVQLSSGLNVAAAGLFYNGMPGTTAALSSNQTLCGGNVNGSIWTGNTPCSASGGQGFTGWYTDSFTSNGSTTQFTLTNTPIYGSQTISLSGMDLISGTDYTISTKTVTFSTAPATGNLLTAFYMY